MRKKVLLMLLAVLMLFSLTACNGSQASTADTPTYEAVEPSSVDGIYQLTMPEHVMYMAENPDKAYALVADIDMGGAIWTPVEEFSGSLTGEIYDIYNYTISNLTIKTAAGDTNVGIFRTVSGTVQEINFENIMITGTGVFTGNLGIVAGQCTAAMTDVDTRNCTITVSVKDANVGMLVGKLTQTNTGCYVTGDMNITLSGGTSYIGGGIGYSEKTVSNTEARVDMNISGKDTAGAAGGIVGYCSDTTQKSNYGGHMNIGTDSDFAAGTLVGKLPSSGVIDSCYNCARSTKITGAVAANVYCGIQDADSSVRGCVTRELTNLDENLPENEQALRQKVVDYMYTMCTIRWSPSQDMHKTDTSPQSYYAGQLYIGLPYSHRNASLEKMLYYLDDNNVLTDGAYALTTPNPYTGVNLKGGAVDVIGNDCADAVYWALSQVSADITYVLTEDMIKDVGTNGMYPVGDYTITDSSSTKLVCKENGAQKIYEAYAKVQMGDVLLYGPGHTRLAAEAAYVFRNADGTINGDMSYILTHEQGGYTDQLQSRHTTCCTNHKYTFAQFFRSNYIPLTIKAYTEGPDEVRVSATNTDLTKTGIAVGFVESNYRIKWVTLQIVDASGAIVGEQSVYTDNSNKDIWYYNTSPETDVQEKTEIRISRNCDRLNLKMFAEDMAAVKLTAGAQYTYRVLVGVTDQELEVQSFKFIA